MTKSEVILTKQIEMNNKWPIVSEIETDAFMLFKNRLDNGQLIVPVKIDRKKACDTLCKDKHLAKIFSSLLDVYDMMPYHPDLAFDSAWRSLEYAMKLYAQRAWNKTADMKLDELFPRFSREVFASLINADKHIQSAYKCLVNNISISALKYMTDRVYFRKELSVAPQIAFVRGRVDSILGKELMNSLYESYKQVDGSLDAIGVKNIARRFERFLQGKDINTGNQSFRAISLENRIELLISGVLYSSRCERFHGDIYSPLKSSKAKLTTYYEYYFLTLCCLFFFWLQLFKLVEREADLIQFIECVDIENAISGSINSMTSILPND